MAVYTKLFVLFTAMNLSYAGIRHMTKRMIHEYNLQDSIPSNNDDMNYDQYEEIVKNGLPKTLKPQHFIIVGSGVAGLSAGKVLSQANHKVTILEAQNRTGGRILTYRAPNNAWYAELGAMRIPDSHRLVNAYIKKFNLSTNPFIMNDPDTFYYVNGQRHKTSVVDQNPGVLNFNLRKNESGKSADDLYNWAVDPVMKEIDLNGWAYIRDKYDTYSVLGFLQQSGLSKEAIEMIGLLNNDETLFQTAFLENIRDSQLINDDTKFVEIVNGTEKLIEAFIPGLEKFITLDAKVTNVRHRANEKVQVTYINSKGEKNTVKGDAIIMTTTAPATSFINFDPMLSQEKRMALRAIHYDASTKIFLHFKRAFWEDYDIHGGKSISDLNTRFTYYLSHNVSEGAGILASYTWGEDAQKWAAMSEEDCMTYALKMLEEIHGYSGSLKDIYSGGAVKKWSMDPYSLGAFALFNPSQESQFYDAIAAHEDRVFFAGEHTTLNHAWIEGSIASGIRAAVEISVEHFDIVVIGGGPIGLAAAYYAGKEGKKVAVFEQYSFHNQRGSSAGQSRQFREMYDKEYLSKLVTDSIPMWKELEKESGEKLLYQDGYLFMGEKNSGATTEGDFAGIVKVCHSLSLKCEELSNSDIKRRFPFRNIPNQWEGLYHEDSGQVDANATVTALLKLLRKIPNVALHENTEVLGINTSLSEVTTGFMKVRTNHGNFKGDRIIIAPGAYANQVLKYLNSTIEMKIWELPSFYYKRQKSAIYPTWFAFGGDNQNLYYGFPENSWDKPGYIRVCPDFVKREISDPSERSNIPDKESLDKTTDFVRKYIPYADSDNVFVANQTCLATSVVDEGFVLDFAPPSVPNNDRIVIFSAGWGFKFVPIFGTIMKQLAIDGRTAYDITAMSINRPGILSPEPNPLKDDNQVIPITIAAIMGVALLVILIVFVVRSIRIRKRQRGYGEITEET